MDERSSSTGNEVDISQALVDDSGQNSLIYREFGQFNVVVNFSIAIPLAPSNGKKFGPVGAESLSLLVQLFLDCLTL